MKSRRRDDDGEEEVLHASSVTEIGDATVVSVLIAFALVSAVALGMNLWIGEKRLPPELHGTTPWFLGVTALLAILAWIKHVRSKIPFRIVEQGETAFLEVVGHMRVEMPFHYSFVWYKVPAGRVEMTCVELGVMDEKGSCLLLLRGTRGAIYRVPDWGPSRRIVGPVKAVFSFSKVLELEWILDQLASKFGGNLRR